MNIFVLDLDPAKCAKYHCDKHVVKMILEHAQLLSTCCRWYDLDIGYKMTHVNHPCSLWVRQSLNNWEWLYELTTCLNSEYKYRYEKMQDHKSYEVVKTLTPPLDLEYLGLTDFALAMPDDVKVLNNPVESYRNYYREYKKDLATWKRRSIPSWMNLNAETTGNNTRPRLFNNL